MQSHAQPSLPDESVDARSLPAEDADDCQLETERPSKRILNESPEQESQLKITSSNTESSKSNASIIPVEDAHDDQLEPPSKKIRSETPTKMNNLTNRLNVPSSWTSQTDEVYQQQIFPYYREFSTVVALLDGRPKSHMKNVYKVQCPYLYHRYMLRKKEYEVKAIAYEEKLLLHATDESKVQSILKENFDWRKVYRAKFGRGVSFSPSAAYANQECSRSNGWHRAIIIAKVLVGKIQEGVRNQLLPSSNYDTTVGNLRNVYVKYYDDEFYPEYIVYYDA